VFSICSGCRIKSGMTSLGLFTRPSKIQSNGADRSFERRPKMHCRSRHHGLSSRNQTKFPLDSPMQIDETRKKADEAISRVVQPVRLERKSTFQFRCHPGVPCFTRCCRNMDIILTPYDIIRIKRRLGLTSDIFLSLYTQAEMLAEARIPVRPPHHCWKKKADAARS